MRVLVTGASGMIGSTAADALLARGDEVVGLTRDPDAARSANPRVRWHRWDPALERPPAEALEGVDGVLNLLGESIDQRLTDSAKKRIVESRETATRNLVAAIAAADQRPAVMVSQSAVGYYGDRDDEVVDESSEPGEGFAAELPIAWEAAAREVENAGVRLVVVRTAPVLDRRGGLLKRLMLPFKLGLGGPIAGGDQYLPGSTSTTRSGSCSGRSTTRRSRGSSTHRRPSRSPTASSRRRSAVPFTGRRCSRCRSLR